MGSKVKRFRRSIFLVSSLLATSMAVWLILREPRYHGRPLGYWTSQSGQWDFEEAAAAEEALRAMGPSAVPYLIETIEKPEPAIRKKLEPYARRFPAIHRMFSPAWNEKQQQAAIALGLIGPPASNAIPALELAVKNNSDVKPRAVAALMKIRGQPVDLLIRTLDTNGISQPWLTPQMEDVWHHGIFIIGEFGTDAEAAVPIVCQALASAKHPMVASTCAQALGRIHSHPELAVPALIAVLETRTDCIFNGLWSLGQFGADAKPAVPVIRKFVNDPNSAYRCLALQALCRILPLDEVKPEEIQALIPLLQERVKSTDPRISVDAENMLKKIQVGQPSSRQTR